MIDDDELIIIGEGLTMSVEGFQSEQSPPRTAQKLKSMTVQSPSPSASEPADEETWLSRKSHDVGVTAHQRPMQILPFACDVLTQERIRELESCPPTGMKRVEPLHQMSEPVAAHLLAKLPHRLRENYTNPPSSDVQFAPPVSHQLIMLLKNEVDIALQPPPPPPPPPVRISNDHVETQPVADSVQPPEPLPMMTPFPHLPGYMGPPPPPPPPVSSLTLFRSH
jgi:hypothetical protein